MKFKQRSDAYEIETSPKKPEVLRKVIAIFMVVVSCLFIYYFLFLNTSDLTSSDELPIIHYDYTPIKIKPKEPGGMLVANMDKAIYDNLTGGEHKPKIERILPAPEEPIIIKQLDNIPITPPPIKEEKKLNDIDILELLEKDIGETAIATTPTPPIPAAEKPTEAETSDTPIKSKQPLNGIKVQLASFKNEKDAISEWNRLNKKYSSLLGKYDYMIKKKNITDKGVYYCLQAGPLKNDASARILCKKLTTLNVGCMVAKE